MNKRFFFIMFIIILTVLIGCQRYDDMDDSRENIQIISPYSTENNFHVTLYYPNSSLNRLDSKDIEIKNITNSLETEILERLIEEIDYDNMINLIPEGTKVLSVDVSDQIAYINFSKEIIKKNITGEEEALLIYSIVNTMTELDSVNSVQLLINGERKEIFSNYYSIENPLKYSKLIVKEDYIDPIYTIKKYYELVREKRLISLVDMFGKADRNENIAYAIQSIDKNISDYNIKSFVINNYKRSILVDVEIEITTNDNKSIEKNEVFSLIFSDEQKLFKINEIYE